MARGSPPPPPDIDPDLVAFATEQANGLRFIPGRLEWVPLAQLVPHPRNANDGDVGAITESIEEVGFYGLILCRPMGDEFQILAGEHRWRALQAEGGLRGPCWVMDVDDETALRILNDNRFTRLGHDRLDVLSQNLAELARTPTGLHGTGFDGDDLDAILRELDPGEPFRPAPQLRPPAPIPLTAACPATRCPSCGHEFDPSRIPSS